MVDYGVRIGNETITGVSGDATIRPLRDQIVLEPLEWKPSRLISVAYKGRPLRGIVRAVGKGVYPKRYNGPKGKRTKTWDSKAFRPCDVKVGDVVELGSIENENGTLDGYLFSTFWWGSKEMILCREEDICGVING